MALRLLTKPHEGQYQRATRSFRTAASPTPSTRHPILQLQRTVDMRLKWRVALLRHNEMAHPVTAVQRQQLVLQLQRRLANTYVRRILEAQRDSRNPGPMLIINR